MQYNLVSKNTREIRKRRTFKPVFVVAAHPKGLNDYTRLESLLPPSLLLLLHKMLAVAGLVVTAVTKNTYGPPGVSFMPSCGDGASGSRSSSLLRTRNRLDYRSSESKSI